MGHKLEISKQYKKDLKTYKNNTKVQSELKKVLDILCNNKKLDDKYRNHKLSGKYKDQWDIHILPNVVLIYKISNDTVYLTRIGTHNKLEITESMNQTNVKLFISESPTHNILNEDIEAVKKYYPNIDDNVFMQLIALDPTYRGKDSLGKYGKWILNLFNKGAIAEKDFDDVTKILNQFTTYRNRIQNKDLNAYKTLDDLSDTLAQVVDDDSMLSDRQKLRFKKNIKAGRVKIDAEDDYDVVFEDSQYIVYVPNTHEASMKLGRGTKWCTAHENRDWYDNYTQDGGKLYIIKNKQTGDRWQYSDKTEDFLDETDSIFDVMTLLESDNSLRNFFIKSIFNLPEDGLYIIKNEYDSKHIPKFVQKLRISTDLDNVNLSGNTNIVSIVLDDGITYIPHRSFANCIRLKSISIPNTVKRIGLQVFENCQSLEKIIIPDSVLQIKNGVFNGCRNLKYVKLPNELDKLPSDLFSYCESLKDVKIPILYTGEIGNRVFQQCISLTSINLPNNLTIVGEAAFSDCSSLTSVMIPNTVEYIREDAFYNCPNLTVYTDSEYVKDYCEENKIPYEPISKAKTESLKLRIKEDTACVASKTSYIDEDGLDKNGIYYFGNKPKLPINWKNYKKDDNRTFKLKESENNHYFYVMAWKGDKLSSSPIRRKRFDIYDNAVEYFNDAIHTFSPDVYVEMFEYIAGKRVMIANSEDGLL